MTSPEKKRGFCDVLPGLLLRWLVIAALWCFAGRALNAEQTMEEYEAKARFLYNFVQYVKWPGAGSRMVGILGDDPFGDKLERAFRGRWTFKRSRRAEDLKNCQIVFVSKSERGNIGAILSSLGDSSALTVGDGDGFARQGGIIGFIIEKEMVRFEINTGAARRAGLELSSDLLKLATRRFN